MAPKNFLYQQKRTSRHGDEEKLDVATMNKEIDARY